MRTVYAIQFWMPFLNDDEAKNAVARTRDRVINWINHKYIRSWNFSDVRLTFDGTTTAPLEGHTIKTNYQSIEDTELLSLEWTHPHDNDNTTSWRTSTTIGRIASKVGFSTEIRIATNQMTIKPVNFLLGRPKIVTETIKSYPAQIQTWPIPTKIDMLTTENIANYVNNTLLVTNRTIPVVLISPDVWSGEYLVDQDTMLSSNLGFAHVAVMDNKFTAFRLTSLLDENKNLSCFNGAVRIYWPGFTVNSPPENHKLFLPHFIEYLKSKEIDFGKYLFDMFAPISAFRFIESDVTKSVQRIFSDIERNQAKRLIKEVENGHVSIKGLEDELLRAWGEIESLREELSDTKNDLAIQRDSWRDYQKHMSFGELEDSECGNISSKTPDGMPEFNSVKEAYDYAEKTFSGVLIFLESAAKSAVDSPYSQPDEVYGIFQALATIAEKWKNNNGKLGNSWEDEFKEYGFTYKDKISQTTATKHKKDYTFQYNKERILFQQHITVGGKQADSCLSIHWFRDDKDKVIAIGHCGRHLPNTST